MKLIQSYRVQIFSVGLLLTVHSVLLANTTAMSSQKGECKLALQGIEQQDPDTQQTLYIPYTTKVKKDGKLVEEVKQFPVFTTAGVLATIRAKVAKNQMEQKVNPAINAITQGPNADNQHINPEQIMADLNLFLRTGQSLAELVQEFPKGEESVTQDLIEKASAFDPEKIISTLIAQKEILNKLLGGNEKTALSTLKNSVPGLKLLKSLKDAFENRTQSIEDVAKEAAQRKKEMGTIVQTANSQIAIADQVLEKLQNELRAIGEPDSRLLEAYVLLEFLLKTKEPFEKALVQFKASGSDLVERIERSLRLLNGTIEVAQDTVEDSINVILSQQATMATIQLTKSDIVDSLGRCVAAFKCEDVTRVGVVTARSLGNSNAQIQGEHASIVSRRNEDLTKLKNQLLQNEKTKTQLKGQSVGDSLLLEQLVNEVQGVAARAIQATNTAAVAIGHQTESYALLEALTIPGNETEELNAVSEFLNLPLSNALMEGEDKALELLQLGSEPNLKKP